MLCRAPLWCWPVLLLVLAACSNGRGSVDEQEPPPTGGAQDSFSIGGTVTGLAGSGLVLQNNGGDDLTIAADGAFTFAARLGSGAAYNVTVRSHPASPAQTCTVANGSGAVASANVAAITVTCGTGQFSVGGSVSGLSGGGLVLQNNGGDDLPIAGNGAFTFNARLAPGAQYRVTVRTQPSNPAQACTLANGSGTIGTTNVTSVRVTCASGTHAIGGAVNGLLGSGLVLRNNGGDDLPVNSNGAFTFATELASGAGYNVSVRTQPSNPDQACTVANGRGTVGSIDVTNISVSCNTADFTIGGTVRDLEGRGLVLRNNGTDALTINADGSFTFETPVPTGASYNVTVAEQPRDPEQICTVSSGSGVVGISNVTSVSVRCAAPPSSRTFEVGGHVSELRGSGLILQNNGGDDLAIASNGSFEFETRLPSGASYSVTVLRQPTSPSQTCNVHNGSGVLGDSKIMNVEVKCKAGDD